MEILEYMQTHGHEQLLICHEPSQGLRAFIAIHDTTLGPACGGLRVWPHESEEDAIMDVLRLSRAMTYKSSVAGLDLGGGKALIMADPHTDKNEAMLRAFGRHVDSLGGRYVTTEDVGMTPRDVEFIAQETKHVVGLPESLGGSGDTSLMTGLGVYLGMKAAAKATWGDDSLSGRTVALQGFGHVGSNTAKHLLEEGAQLVVTDIYQSARQEASSMGATVVEPDAIYDVECDIFSPCALGGVLNEDTIPRIRSRIVAGGANNQLLSDSDGDLLDERGITYAPDYVINAGGIINVGSEIGGVYRKDRALELTKRIYQTTLDVIETARSEGIPTYVAADRIAERRIAAVRSLKPML
ncbi:MAG: Glu/Leu/Phe/Val dehydrogenase [Chloroflexi bacterium]|nr:Glu/Leu/Phe/Val dehydrogenase [Chloroflexota bacterium]